MTPVNKCLNKVVKLNLWVFKPIRRLTLHYSLQTYLQFQHRTFYQSDVILRNFRVVDFNSILKIVFETSGHKTPIVSYLTITKNNTIYYLYNTAACVTLFWCHLGLIYDHLFLPVNCNYRTFYQSTVTLRNSWIFDFN